ncbi:MAG: polynucleotide adenylyltransferase PcnB, partial [Acidovorax sp.]
WTERLAQRQHPLPALQDAIDDVFDKRIGDVSGRGKLAADMREIWVMQPRFEKRVGSTPFGMVMQPRFRAGFDFLRLRADVGEIDEALAEWWQDCQAADDDRREDLMDQAREEQKARQRVSQPTVRRVPKAGPAGDGQAPQPPKPRAPRAAAATDGGQDEGDDFAPEHGGDAVPPDGSAPKKRRRRRRKPTGGGGGGEGSAAPAAQ